MTPSMRMTLIMSCFLVVFAPLYYAGKTPEGVFVIQSASLLLLFFVVWSGEYSNKLFALAWWYLGLSLLLAGLYLLPLPLDVWQQLPGREVYLDSVLWLQQQGEVFSPYVSIVPGKSVYALMALIPAVAIFLSALSLPREQLHTLVYVFLAVALVQALLGLIQYTNDDPVFRFGLSHTGRYAQGMYVNRDHFAALMEMALPISLALFLFHVGRGRFNQVLLFAFIALAILLAGVFSRSRAGVFIIILMVLLSSMVFARHIGGRQSAGITGFFIVIAGGLATSIGLIPVFNRFMMQDPLEDGRWPIFETTIQAIKALFPVGGGPGTYSEIYRLYQPVEQAFFANHAHNDYLELLLEMGAAGAFVILGFFILYIIGWFRLSGGSWNQVHFLQVGAGLSILAMLLHALVDFNLHTPANLLVFAFVVGIFFRKKAL